MIKHLKKLNTWIRNFMLDDVDKDYGKILPHHKKFGSKKDPVDRIEKRFDQQKRHSKHGHF